MPNEQAPPNDNVTILLNEPNSEVVVEYLEKYAPKDQSINIIAKQVSLQEAADWLKNGEGRAVVSGATTASKEVLGAAFREIGVENKDASSFFVMEKEGDSNLYFADCAVNPDPSPVLLARIAEQTCESVSMLGDKPVVAFISHEDAKSDNEEPPSVFVLENKNGNKLYLANYDTHTELGAPALNSIAEETSNIVNKLGDKPVVAFLSYSTSGSGGSHPSVVKVQEAAAAFRDKHPQYIVYGDIQFDAARNEDVYKKKHNGEGFINEETPNVLVFPDADSADSVRKALLMEGDYTVAATYPPENPHPKRPSAEKVTHPSKLKTREAAALFQAKHPEVTVYPDITYDAARNEEIFKSGHEGRGFINGEAPNVFIFSNLDTGNTMYKTLEVEGGYAGVGPLLQGLDNNADFHDLSRGVTAESLERICLTVGKLVRAKRDARQNVQSISSEPEEDMPLAA